MVDKLPTSTGEFTGFLVAINSMTPGSKGSSPLEDQELSDNELQAVAEQEFRLEKVGEMDQ